MRQMRLVGDRTSLVDKGDSLRVGPLIRRYRLLLISSAAESAGQGVGGVPVEVVPGPVVAASGARVRVAGEVLHVPERNPRIQGGGDRRMPQAVRAQLVRGGDTRGAGQAADQPPHGGFAEASA